MEWRPPSQSELTPIMFNQIILNEIIYRFSLLNNSNTFIFTLIIYLTYYFSVLKISRNIIFLLVKIIYFIVKCDVIFIVNYFLET